MKFTDGCWQTRPGMTPHYAVQVHDVEIESDAMTVYAATGKLTRRGDTVNHPIITLRFSTPMENVIRLQMSHHKDHQPRHPDFELYDPTEMIPIIIEDQVAATLTSGQLSVKVHKGDHWLVEYKAGEQFPVHWGGDSTTTFESLAESLRGGFEQTANADVYKCWTAFGLLSSHIRLHGSSS